MKFKTRSRAQCACTLAIASALAGCAVGPNYHRPPAPLAPAFKESQDWKPATPGQIDSDKPWWSIYSDPLLDSLERQIEVSNQTLKADEAAYRAAVEVVAIDRGSFLPSVSATGSLTRSGSGATGVNQAIATGSGTITAPSTPNSKSTVRNLYSLGAQASWTLDVWGRIRRQVESDVARAQASAADVAAAKLSAQITLASDYFQLRAADEQARLYKTDIEDFQNALTITQNQVKAGITTLADVYAAETQLESTEAAAVNVELTRAKFEHAIAVLTGKPPSELTIPDGPFVTVVPVIPSGVPSSLLERRPDIAAAERDVASANALIGVAEAAWFPTLTLSGSYGFTSTVLTGLISAHNSLWSFGPALAENLFNGGATLAQTREARANYDQAVATYRQTVLSAFQSVEDDLASLRVLEHQGELQQTAVRDARSSEALTLNQYKSGIVAYSSVITSQTTRLADEISLLSIQSQALVSSVDLISQLGGGWDAAQLNRQDRGVPSK
ncbi:MAG TPA: efflux transporter outer membrane subunit [Steroidobacteraceae bacterium]|jgi:NodT family efflux transporter outer membrane factor (OMF) lipoprotein|nr:efflux transporter outer membrane subunit [Steroidobacteraceae bacterium]